MMRDRRAHAFGQWVGRYVLGPLVVIAAVLVTAAISLGTLLVIASMISSLG